MDLIARLFPPLRRHRPVTLASMVLALVITLVAINRPTASKNAPEPAPVAMTVTTTALSAASLTRTMAVNGSIHPWQEIIVGPEISGYRVTAVRVDVGDVVKKGQELVRLANDIPAAELTAKRAQQQQMQASLDNAAAAYRRAESLSASGAL